MMPGSTVNPERSMTLSFLIFPPIGPRPTSSMRFPSIIRWPERISSPKPSIILQSFRTVRICPFLLPPFASPHRLLAVVLRSSMNRPDRADSGSSEFSSWCEILSILPEPPGHFLRWCLQYCTTSQRKQNLFRDIRTPQAFFGSFQQFHGDITVDLEEAHFA